MISTLHFAFGYIPKRLLRFYLEGNEERMSSLVQEMERILANPDSHVEEGTSFLYYGFMILASKHREEGISLLSKIGRLSVEQVEIFLGDHLFDSMPVAIAELYRDRPYDLQGIIENFDIEPSIRAASLQAMMVLFGQKRLTRDKLVSYFRALWEHRSEKIPYFYDILAAASMSLYPEELIDQISAAYKEGFIDQKQLTINDVEEILALPKEEVIAQTQQGFSADLSDLIGHVQQQQKGNILFERNDPCPCDSGLKFKRCCQ